MILRSDSILVLEVYGWDIRTFPGLRAFSSGGWGCFLFTIFAIGMNAIITRCHQILGVQTK